MMYNKFIKDLLQFKKVKINLGEKSLKKKPSYNDVKAMIFLTNLSCYFKYFIRYYYVISAR